VPPCAVSPGSSTCSPENGPGCTTKLLLVPEWGGDEKSEQVRLTAPPAPRNTTTPDQVPFVNVISSGEMLPGPVLAISSASPAKSGTVLLLASTARTIAATATPAVTGEPTVAIA